MTVPPDRPLTPLIRLGIEGVPQSIVGVILKTHSCLIHHLFNCANSPTCMHQLDETKTAILYFVQCGPAVGFHLACSFAKPFLA